MGDSCPAEARPHWRVHEEGASSPVIVITEPLRPQTGFPLSGRGFLFTGKLLVRGLYKVPHATLSG